MGHSLGMPLDELETGWFQLAPAYVSRLLDHFGNPVRLGLAWPAHHLYLVAET
jgi:hypothetical protein